MYSTLPSSIFFIALVGLHTATLSPFGDTAEVLVVEAGEVVSDLIEE